MAKNEMLMPHFHLPLQSGCNRILSEMRRRYTAEQYAEKVHKIKKLMPDACVACDVIVGFPGETEEDFDETYNFLSELPISYMHVFSYSRRPRTAANIMENQISEDVKSERSERLIALSNEKKRAFYEQCAGQDRPVLVESQVNDDMLSGFTDNYIRVQIPYSEDIINTIQTITVDPCRTVL